MSTRHNGQHLRILLVLLMLGFAAFPIYWMFVTSMTPSSELFATSPRLLPEWSQLGIYLEVFNTIPVATWLKNSFLVAAGTTVLSILLAVLPAYALSRFRFTGLALLGFALFATQMLPEAMLVVPLYSIFADLNLLNTASGLILANTAFVVPVITWIIKAPLTAYRSKLRKRRGSMDAHGWISCSASSFRSSPPHSQPPQSFPFSMDGMNMFSLKR